MSLINDKPAAEYFADSKYLLGKLDQPFTAVDLNGKYDMSARVTGGGHEGQIETIRLGIAKALVVAQEDLKSTLKRADLLSRDSRERERKKFGLRGARKQRQFTRVKQAYQKYRPPAGIFNIQCFMIY